MIEAFKPWVLAFRPKTLTAALIPVLIGISLGASMTLTQPRWDLAAWAILSAICIQIATNLINDALDFKKGTDTENRLGPTRVSASGMLDSRFVFWGGLLFFALAALCAIPLITHAGMPILLIGFLSILAGYVYTGGPFPLAYNGLGDLFVILFFGLVAVGGTYFLQTSTLTWAALVAGLQIGCLATVLIAINNLRDVQEDARNHKKTLAVRFGARFVRFEILLLNLLTLGLSLYWLNRNFQYWWFPFLSAPFMIYLTVQIFRNPPSKIYNRYLAQAAMLHVLFGGLMVAMLLLGRSYRFLEVPS